MKTLHLKRSAEPSVVVKGYLNLIKKKFECETEEVNMKSHLAISWLGQNVEVL